MAEPSAVIPLFVDGAPTPGAVPVASLGGTVLLRITPNHYVLVAPRHDAYPHQWLLVNLPSRPGLSWWTTCRPGPRFMLDCWAE